MKSWLLLLWFVLVVALLPLSGVITPENQVSCVTSSATNLSCAASTPLTVAAGDAIVLIIRTAIAGSTGYTINDGGCNEPWLHQTYTGNFVDFWTAINATAGSCTITVSRPNGNDAFLVWVARTYSGVQSLGAYLTGSNSTGAGSSGYTSVSPCSQTIATLDPGNYVVAGASWNQGTSAALNVSIVTGTSRFSNQNVWTFQVGDNTSATAANTTVSYSWTINAGTTAYCRMNMIELRAASTITGGRLARLSDQMQTVLLTGSTNQVYTLPNAVLSPTWCAWVMPTGTATTYQIAVQSPAQLNGQANPVTLGVWQMSRVCEDSPGNYWLNPSVQAGSGIALTPSANAIQVSTTAVGTARNSGAVAGVARLGGKSIAANGCDETVREHRAGIEEHDTVNFSLTRDPGSSLASLKIETSVSTGEVNFRLCNSGTRAVTPQTFTLNWQAVH